TPQVEFEGKVITMRLNKETGVYIAVSTQGKPSLFPETKKTKKREGLTEEDQCKFSILDKIEYCLASEGVRIIETTNVEALKAWIVAEMRDKNSISVNLDKETGMYTAVSKPKKEGE
ncbi:MAG: hypothetical protein FWH36_03970, partial [Lentimicrobiaceae bacterium]|nr:hypothetical protein [Lentimicrobiaceae bacterium]